MKKIIDYHVFHNTDVTAAIKDGWQPWGSAVGPMKHNGWDNAVMQPCVRYEGDAKVPPHRINHTNEI